MSFAVGSVSAADTSILLEEQSGLMKGDDSVIDYSMQNGSLDVGVRAGCVLVCRVSCCACVCRCPVPVPCGLALSAELRLYPGLFFQLWNFDCDMAHLSLQTVFNWTFHVVAGSDSWIQSGFLRRLVEITGCSCAAAFFVKNLLLVDLFSSAVASVGLISQIIVLAATAAAAAIVATRPRNGAQLWGELSTIGNYCRDMEVKLAKHSELLDEAVARKSAFQDEINEIEARIAAAEAEDPRHPPQGPAPDVQVTFPPPPAEEEVDEEMDNEGSGVPGSGVGDFMTPSRKKVIKSPFMKRASLRLTETWSSRSSVRKIL